MDSTNKETEITPLGWATTFNDGSVQIMILHGRRQPTEEMENEANDKIDKMLRSIKIEE